MSETTAPPATQAALPLAEPAAPAEPVAAPAAVPVAATPAPESAPPQAPAAEPAAEAAAEAAKPELHTDTPTLLQEATTEAPKTEDKPAEPKPEAKPAEAAPAVTYEPFTLPEGATIDQERMTAFTDAAGKAGLTQDAAQSFVDMHLAAMQQYAENALAEQHRIFAETRSGWRDAVKSDEQIGGAGHETAMRAIARMRDKLVPAERREAFNQFLATTGAGDHPEFLRVFFHAARLFDEPVMPAVAPKPAPQPAPRRGGLRAIYDSPAMQRAAGG